jgi:arylsulfatase
MFRDLRYKLTVYHHVDMQERKLEGELYDMVQDPDETHNLWSEPAATEIRQDLLARVMDWMVAMDSTYVGTRGGERPTNVIM